MDALQDRGSELRREYMRNWRAKNRDKVREYNARYWAVSRVRQLIAAGKVKHINAGRRILVNLDSLAQYMEQGEPQEQTNPGGMWRIPE